MTLLITKRKKKNSLKDLFSSSQDQAEFHEYSPVTLFYEYLLSRCTVLRTHKPLESSRTLKIQPLGWGQRQCRDMVAFYFPAYGYSHSRFHIDTSKCGQCISLLSLSLYVLYIYICIKGWHILDQVPWRKHWHLCAGVFRRECSQEQDQHEDEGSRPGQKSNSDAAALKASANPLGSSGAGMTLQRRSDLRQGWRVLVRLQWPLIK